MASSSAQLMMPKPSKTDPSLEVKQETGVMTQETSLELARIMVLVAVSSIMFLRTPFRQACYDTLLYDEQMTYENFKAQKTGSMNIGDSRILNKKGMRAFQVLSRGHSTQVDKIMDWIELGILDALKKKCLNTAQLAIFHQTFNVDNVAEVYTISFEYKETGEVDIKNINQTLESQGVSSESQGISVNLARDQVKGTVSELIKVIQELDDLPTDLILGVQLNYNDRCPEDYQPSGFQKCLDLNSTLPEQSGVLMGTVSTGYHSVGLQYSVKGKQRFSNLRRADRKPNTQIHSSVNSSPSSTASTPDMPSNWSWLRKTYGPIPPEHGDIWRDEAEYLKACNAAYSFVYKRGMHKPEADAMRDSGRLPDLAKSRKLNPDYKHYHTTLPSLGNDGVEAGDVNYIPPRFVNKSGQDSQASRPRRAAATVGASLIKRQLESPFEEEDENAAQLNGTRISASQGSSQANLQSEAIRNMANSRNPRTVDTQAIAYRFNYRPILRLKDLNKLKLIKSLRKWGMAVNLAPRNPPETNIKCECGSRWKDDDLVDYLLACKNCGYWQHGHCYGYVDGEADKYPDCHVCYHCLLSERHPALYEAMKDKCKVRIFLFYIYTEERLGRLDAKLNIINASRVLLDSRLENEGFLEPAVSRGASYHSRVIRNPTSYGKLWATYFNPAYLLTDFFVDANVQDSSEEEGMDEDEDDDEDADSQFLYEHGRGKTVFPKQGGGIIKLSGASTSSGQAGFQYDHGKGKSFFPKQGGGNMSLLPGSSTQGTPSSSDDDDSDGSLSIQGSPRQDVPETPAPAQGGGGRKRGHEAEEGAAAQGQKRVKTGTTYVEN